MITKTHPLTPWLALLIAVPLAVNPWSRWQYEPDKRALLLLFAGLLAARALWRADLPRLGRSRVETWLGAYLLVRLLAAICGVAPDWSLWGDPAWRNGLWPTLAGAVLFLLARRTFTTPERRELAITAILAASGLVAAYGVVQYAHMDPFGPRENVVRVASTLAHPNLLAAYLAMILPLAAARLWQGPHRTQYAALLALLIICLVFTYSRAGWLAAGTGLAAWGMALLHRNGQKRLALALAAALVIGLAGLLVLSALPPLPGSAPHPLQTLTTLFRWKGATAQIRLHGWTACLDAIRARPLLGYGPATFRMVLEWNLPPDLAPYGGAGALDGHAHNVYLAVAVESGLLGLLIYLGLLVAILRPALRSEIGAALLTVLVNNLFSFDSAATLLLFWTLAGMVHAPEGQIAPPARTVPRPRLATLILAGTCVLVAWMVVPDMASFQAEHARSTGRWAEAVRWGQRAADLAPVPDVFQADLGTVYAAWATQSNDPAHWQAGEAILAAWVADDAQRVDAQAQYALYLRRWHAAQGDPALAERAIQAYSEAIRLSPRHPDFWLDRGLTRLQSGDPASALADFEHANTLLPNYRRYYGAMAAYALAMGDVEAAQAWNEQALAAQQEWDDWVWRR